MSNTVDNVLVKSSGGDWEGIYVNKKLFIQGHSSHADMLLAHLCEKQMLISSFKERTVLSEWLNKTGWLPQLLEDCMVC
jgi:hypothetical protein